MKRDTLMKPGRVAQRLDCGVTVAKRVMKNKLGGWYDHDLGGWRCTERAVDEYMRRKAKGAACTTEDQNQNQRAHSPFSHEQQSAAGTGTATSERLTADDRSVGSISAPTTQEIAGMPPSPRTGTSKRAQHLVSLIDSDRRGRSSRRIGWPIFSNINVEHFMKRTAARAGLGKRSANDARGGLATRLAGEGVNAALRGAIMGNSERMQEATYSQPHLLDEQLAEAMNQQPRVSKRPQPCIARASANAGSVPNMAAVVPLGASKSQAKADETD